jgi:ATP-dependent DNA helicase RecG
VIPDESELRALLSRPEGQFLEFKSLRHQAPGALRPLARREVRDLIAEYVAAFANADGGRLLLGVEDDGAATGFDYPPDAVEEFLRVPQIRLRPPLAVQSAVVSVDGIDVIVFDVEIAPEAVMVEGDGFPYRAGDRVIAEPQLSINDRKQSYRRVGFERMVRPDATMDDLDLALLSEAMAQTPDRNATPEQWLANHGLVTPRGDITNAALLLFARQLPSWHPAASVRIFRVDGRERLHGSARNVEQVARITAPIVSAIPEVHRVLSSIIRRSEKLTTLLFEDTPEYPSFAWQEALVNAVAHRDYANQNQGVEVWLYVDRLEVRSVGDLVAPVTLDALRKRRPVHASRNPLITRVLAETRLMREEGEGIPRMFDEMSAALLRAPEFEFQDGTFTARLWNESILSSGSPEWHAIVNRMNISSRQRRALLAYPEGFTVDQFERVNETDRATSDQEIRGLVSEGVVEPIDGQEGSRYGIRESLRQSRTWLGTRASLLREHFTSHPALTNTNYRAIFEVPRHVAVDELRLLVIDGFLLQVGERRGAHYVPGPMLQIEPSHEL